MDLDCITDWSNDDIKSRLAEYRIKLLNIKIKLSSGTPLTFEDTITRIVSIFLYKFKSSIDDAILKMIKLCSGKCLFCKCIIIINNNNDECVICDKCTCKCTQRNIVMSREWINGYDNFPSKWGIQKITHHYGKSYNYWVDGISNIIDVCDDIISNRSKIFDIFFGINFEVTIMIIISSHDSKSSINMLPIEIICYILKFIYQTDI